MMCAPCGLAADLNTTVPAWRLPDAAISAALDQGFDLTDLMHNRRHVVEALHGRCQAEAKAALDNQQALFGLVLQPPGCPCHHKIGAPRDPAPAP